MISPACSATSRDKARESMQFKKETYSSKAAEFIRGLIRSGELLPGQPVREALISEKLKIKTSFRSKL